MKIEILERDIVDQRLEDGDMSGKKGGVGEPFI